MKTEEIYQHLTELFPDAHCELEHKNAWEMAVAVILSAQATDVSVNKVTPSLFEKYPDAAHLASAELKDVEQCIRTIGLYRNKAKSIVNLSIALVERFEGEIPGNMDDLLTLPGVGRKSANVILSECFNVPAIAVDTHVTRVSKRLGLAKPEDDVLAIEKKLMRKFPKEKWSRLHHLLIFFGRYKCKATKPDCTDCPFSTICKKDKIKI